ncbi:MAG: universal stress protein [Anaerolineaceae bacterium]|nr:MAG: universal stress protein [Anaerolineaceae bacterium]
MNSEIFIFTNGRPTTFPAIEYGTWLGASLRTPVRLIGLDEDPSPSQIDEETHPLEEIFSKAVEAFRSAGVDYMLEVQQGHAEEMIPARLEGQEETLVVLGPLGRPPLKRLWSGRSFRHIMEHVGAPILYVPHVRLPLKRMLVCLGGLGYEVTAETLAMKIARIASSEVTLLTVVTQMDLDYPEARHVRENWQHLADTDTLTGRGLRRGLEFAQQAGLRASVKVRNGNVVEEILAELKEGNYDLLVMGSLFSANALRQMYTPNVTAEIAETDLVPVLTARYARG